MAYTGALTAGNEDAMNGVGGPARAEGKTNLGAKKGLFLKKNPGSPGRLSRNATTKSESLAKLRGKGALA